MAEMEYEAELHEHFNFQFSFLYTEITFLRPQVITTGPMSVKYEA